MKQSGAEMSEAEANEFLDRAAELLDIENGDDRIAELLRLVDEVRQREDVRIGFAAGRPLSAAPDILEQQAADLERLIDRSVRNVYQQLGDYGRIAMARVQAVLRRTDVELPEVIAADFVRQAIELRGLPIAEQPFPLQAIS